MKKLLLSIACISTIGFAFAQPPVPPSSFIIYNGTASGFPFSYSYGTGFHVSQKSLGGGMYLVGGGTSVGYDAGGFAVGGYGTNGPLPLGFTGTPAATAIQFAVKSDTTTNLADTSASPLDIKVQFATPSGKAFGFEWNFTDSVGISTGIIASVPLSSFGMIVNYQVTSTPVPDSLWQNATSIVQFTIATKANAGAGAVAFALTNVELVPYTVTGLSNNSISAGTTLVYPNPCNTGVLNLGNSDVSYTLINATGVTVKTGVGSKIDVSNLEKGIYMISTGNGGPTSKVILN